MSTGPQLIESRIEERGSDYLEVQLRDRPRVLAALGRGTDLAKLVTSLRFLDLKLRRFGLDPILDDVDSCAQLAPEDDADGYRALADALRLARPALERDASELPAQIFGRLITANRPVLAALTTQARTACHDRLLPLTPALTQGRHPMTEVLEAQGGLSSLAVSADGRFAVTSAKDGMVTVWSLPLRGNSRMHSFRVSGLNALCLSPDGRFILTGDGEGRVAKWDRTTGFREALMETGGDSVLRVTLAGPYLVALLRFSEVCVIRMASFESAGTFHADVAQSVCGVSADRLLVGTADGFLDVFDPQKGERSRVLGWHGGYKNRRMSDQELFIRSMAALPNLVMSSGPDDMRKIDFAAALDSGDFSEQDKRAYQQLLKEDPHRHMVDCLSKDADGAPLALSACHNGELALLDVVSDKVIRRFLGKAPASCCALSSERRLVVAGFYGGSIRIWDMDSGAEVGTLAEGGPTPADVQFVPISGELIAGFEDGRIQVWRDPAGARGDLARPSGVARVMTTITGQPWAVSDSIRTWTPDGGAEIRRIEFAEAKNRKLFLSADRRRVLSTTDHQVAISDIASGWSIATVDIEPVTIGAESVSGVAKIQYAAATPDLQRIVLCSWAELLTASVGNHSRLEMVDATGAAAQVLDERAGLLSDLRISPDGRWAATLSDRAMGSNISRQELRLWDLETGASVWEQFNADVEALAFSEQGGDLWFKAGHNLHRYKPGRNAEAEYIGAVPTPWSIFIVDDQLTIGAARNTIEVREASNAEVVGSLSLDAEILAFCVAGQSIVVSDAHGAIHFLKCGRLGRTAESANERSDSTRVCIPTQDKVLDALDNAAELSSTGDSERAVRLWRDIATANAAWPELRLSIAAQLKRIGHSDVCGAVCTDVATDASVRPTIRLRAIRTLPSEHLLLGLRALAARVEDAQITNPDGSDRQTFRELLERMIEEGAGTDLDSAIKHASTPEVACAAIAHAVGRLNEESAVRLLTGMAKHGTSARTRTLALEGLRHLATVPAWLDAAAGALSRSPAEEDLRNAVTDMLLLKTRVATGLIALGRSATPWYDLGLLASYSELNNHSMGLTRAKRHSEAEALLRRGTKIFAGDAGLHVNLSGLLVQQGRYEEAIAEATLCLELDPQYEKALNFRAYARMELDRYELALEDLNRALQLKPEDFANLRNRSNCYMALGRVKEAERDLLKSRRIQEQLGDDAAPGFETSDRRSAALKREPTVTDEDIATARRFLDDNGLLVRAIAWTNTFAVDTALPLEFRDMAVEGLAHLGAEQELLGILQADSEDARLRIRAASMLWRMNPEAARSNRVGSRYKEALQYLTGLVTNPAERPDVRHGAAYELVDSLAPNEIEQLASSIPDARSRRDEALPGVDVALVLIKSLGQRREFSRLARLARSREANGWLRELASQTMGAYAGRERARELSTAHLSEKPADRALVSAIERALAYYRQEEKTSFSPDPVVEQAFEELAALPSAEGVPALSRRYAFLTDSAFIGQLKNYVRRRNSPEIDSLRAKLKVLETLPPSPEQMAIGEFVGASSPEEMRKAAEKIPLLTQPHFQEWLESVIRDTASMDDQPAMWQRMEWLRAIPQDEYQNAMHALVWANTLEEVRPLAEQYPFIKSERFRAMVGRAQVVGAPPELLQRRLEWLQSLGKAPEDALLDDMTDALTEGRTKDALRSLEKLRRLAPERPPGMLAGEVYLQNGEYQKAVDCFTRAIESGASGLAYERRGKALFSLGRRIEAVNDFTNALEESPDSKGSLLGRGLALTDIGNLKAAVADLEKALALPDGAEDELVAFPLALAYLRTGHIDRAEQMLREFPHWSADFEPQVRKLLEHLNDFGRPFDPAQAAVDAMKRSHPDDIARLIEENPIFLDPEFQVEMDRYIGSISDERERRELAARFDLVLKIVRNPAQLAFEAFMDAEDLAAMQSAIEGHELLRGPEFIEQLRSMRQSVDPAVSQRIARQLALHSSARRTGG